MNTIAAVASWYCCVQNISTFCYIQRKVQEPHFSAPFDSQALSRGECGFLEIPSPCLVSAVRSPIHNKSGQQSQNKKDGTLNLFHASSWMINVTLPSSVSANRQLHRAQRERGRLMNDKLCFSGCDHLVQEFSLKTCREIMPGNSGQIGSGVIGCGGAGNIYEQ